MYLQVNDLRPNSQRMLFKYQGINRETAGEGCSPDAPSRQSSSRRPNPYLLLVMVITDGKFTSFMGDHGNGINAPVLLSNFQP